MQQDDLDFMIRLVHKRSGVLLTREQRYLVNSRLTPLARMYGYKDLHALTCALRMHHAEPLLTQVTEAMMTNETYFFRDCKPFEQMRKTLLPDMRLNAGERRMLKIWSAACSSGQEPYSIAITLMEDAEKNPGWEYDIVATDISTRTLDKARLATYSQFEVQRGLPIHTQVKYFRPNPDSSWQAKDVLRSMVRFEVHNLLQAPPSGLFDLIFCRNVLIYFDDATKAAAVDRLCDALAPGGFLVIGSTEAILEMQGRLIQPEGLRGIYRFTGKPLTSRDTKRKAAR